MKKTIRNTIMAFALVAGLSFTSCKDNRNEEMETETLETMPREDPSTSPIDTPSETLILKGLALNYSIQPWPMPVTTTRR